MHLVKTNDGRFPKFRSDDADVKDPEYRTNVVLQAIIPAAEWASIVASVSKTGETSESYAAAAALHGEGPQKAP
mgnify:CR=1 FL=1